MEYLDSMVARVGDDDHAVGADGNTRRRPELPVGAALRTEREGMGAVVMEYLDSMVARVGDDERAVVIQGNALGRPELAVAVAGGIVARGRGRHDLGMGGVRQHGGRQEQ